MINANIPKICILYNFYEANSNYKKNFQHFLTFAINPAVDYCCIIAGEHSVDLPSLPNLTYIHAENKNWDYGGYDKALKDHVPTDAYEYLLLSIPRFGGRFSALYEMHRG